MCIFPINLFTGIIELDINGVKHLEEAPLSLSYFFGLGFNAADLEGIESFYLTKQGWALVVCILLGLPTLITYRVYLQGKNKK